MILPHQYSKDKFKGNHSNPSTQPPDRVNLTNQLFWYNRSISILSPPFITKRVPLEENLQRPPGSSRHRLVVPKVSTSPPEHEGLSAFQCNYLPGCLPPYADLKWVQLLSFTREQSRPN